MQAWEARRLEGLARSMLDGLAVWLRELYRPPDERSPGVIRHETARSERMVDLWEKEIAHPLMRGALNMQSLTLACALGLEARNPGTSAGGPAIPGFRRSGSRLAPDRDAPVVRGRLHQEIDRYVQSPGQGAFLGGVGLTSSRGLVARMQSDMAMIGKVLGRRE